MISPTQKICLSVLLFALVVFLPTPSFSQNALPITDEARQQIADLLAVKKTFTAAEKKMSSNLIFANRQARGVAVGIPAGLIDTRKVVGGMIEVEIKARVSDGLLNRLAGKTAQVKEHSAKYNHVHASVVLASLHLLAEDPDVILILEKDEKLNNVGSLTSQGYISHRAREAMTNGVTGNGVKVGVLSDSASATRVAALIASGDLGSNTVVLAASSGTDEGTAMMEIIHDIAPGAQLFYATANSTEATFANNIAALATNGCSIIVDDYTYFAEAAFQDGIVAQAVNAFVAGGGLYFSSAANSGNLTLGTSGTWEGDFLNGGPVTSGPLTNSEPVTAFYHDFGTVGSPQLFNLLTAIGSRVTLKWADPLGGSANDYDLFILNSAGNAIKGSSISAQTGFQNPYESISSITPVIGDRVVVVLRSGNPCALRVDTHRGRLSIGTTGSTFGHNAGQNTVSMAATSWNSARTGTFPFNGASNVIETFSSDGPRKMFFNPDGSPITPGNFLFATGGGVTLQKPDLTACDGVATKTPTFFGFYGTSAAAPHAAGIAALVKSAKPSLTGPQIKQILINTAMDNMAPGVDRDGGHGVLNAQAAVQAALAP